MAKAKVDDPGAVIARCDRLIPEVRTKIIENENTYGDPEVCVKSWMDWSDEHNARFWNSANFLTPPDRQTELVQPAPAEQTPAVQARFGSLPVTSNLHPMIAALGGEVLKEKIAKFIRDNWPKDWITEEVRTARKAKLAAELFELECEREKAARYLESLGASVDRPADMNPEIFLAAEL